MICGERREASEAPFNHVLIVATRHALHRARLVAEEMCQIVISSDVLFESLQELAAHRDLQELQVYLHCCVRIRHSLERPLGSRALHTVL